jgi:hypothetical protein
MSPARKQLLILIGAIVALALIGIAVYLAFFRGTAGPETTPSGGLPGQPNPSLPTSGQSGTKDPGESGGEAYETTLFQIHDKPIVSFVVFVRSGHSYARLIEQGSGHVYEYDFDTKQKIRISNTSIPGIQAAVWSQDGTTAAFQYLEGGVVRTAIGDLATSSTEGSFKKITFLPAGLGSVALSPSGDEVAYARITTQGGAVAVAKKDGTKARVLFASPLTRWFIEWKSKDILLVESPLSRDGGVAYAVNVRTGAQSTVEVTHGSFPGLTPARDGATYIYNPSWALGVTRLDTKKGTEFALFSMNTIPDKCSFIATSTDYALCGTSDAGSALLTRFEEWLRGEGTSHDSIFLVNFKRGYWTAPIRSADLGDLSFDVEHIEGDDRLSFAAFKEKEGQTLWGIWLRSGLIY